MEEHAHLVWKGGLRMDASIRDLHVPTDKPESKGGTDAGPMPSELYLAALGSCMMMSVKRVADKRSVPIEGMEADATTGFDDRGRVRDLRLVLTVRSPADPGDWETVARLAPRFCTLDMLTEPPIEKTLQLEDGPTMPLGDPDA